MYFKHKTKEIYAEPTKDSGYKLLWVTGGPTFIDTKINEKFVTGKLDNFEEIEEREFRRWRIHSCLE